MVEVETRRILRLSTQEQVECRDGKIDLDIDEVAPREGDIQGILTVGAGLEARDFAVFLGYPELDLFDETNSGEGYFVSQVDAEDGSGILVHSSLVFQSPRSYAEGRAGELLSYLHESDPSVLEDFSLQALSSFIKNRK